MVSTRQMSTTLSTANNSVANDETVRLSVVTRQTSSSSNNNNNSMMSSNATTIPSTATPSSTSSAAASSSSSTISRLSSSSLSSGGNASNQSNITTQQICKASVMQQRQLHLLDLPTEILGTIFSYVGYKKVGHMRVISHKFNDVCMHVLNSTFSKLITQTFNRFQAIKASMPRRESARRNHHLATECDIIETCYMRLSLLQMTFGKRIERGHCCFFPGAILDEVYTVLNYIRNTPRLERPYRVTDELFDLSTMAMEYFRDKIEPKLPDIAYFNKNFFALSAVKRPLIIASDLSDNSSSLPSPPQSNMVLRKGIRKIKQGMKMYNNQLSVLRNELRTWKRKASEQGKQIADQQKILAEQQKQTLEYANRLDENDKKNEEMARKFSTLLQELNKCKTELQYWRSKSPATPTCTSCGQKTVCTLPLEEYNALINQGVKPEDILNIDDTYESDGTSLSNDCEFVFPDESTTAKLLAVSMLSRNLKRQHDTDEQNASVVSDVQSQSTSSVSRMVDVSQMNDKALSSGGKVTTNVTTNSTSTTSTGSLSTFSSDLNLDVSLGKSSNSSSERGKIKNVTTIDDGRSNNNSNSSMITDHQNGKNASIENIGGNSNNNSVNLNETEICTYGGIIMAGGNVDGGAGVSEPAMPSNGGYSNTEDITSLNSITSHETKKARRVQKTSRFSSGNGKRK